MRGGMEKELPKCGLGGLLLALPGQVAGSAGQLCGRAGDSVGTREGFSVCWGKMTQCEGAGRGEGVSRDSGKVHSATWL